MLFLLDGSDTSFDGLSNAIAFCKRFNKELTVLHAFNEDLKKYSRHIKIVLKKAQEERPDFKFEQVFQEKDLLEAVKERENNYDWIIVNKNGYRGSINKQRFVGSNTSKVIEEVNCNLILFAWSIFYHWQRNYAQCIVYRSMIASILLETHSYPKLMGLRHIGHYFLCWIHSKRHL